MLRVLGASLMCVGLVAGCSTTAGPASPSTAASSSPAGPSAAPSSSSALASVTSRPTPAPTAVPLSWADILGEKRTFGAFTLSVDPAYAGGLMVKENGTAVGSVYVDTYSAADWTFDITGPEGLARVATDFAETMHTDRTTRDPAGTYTPMPPTAVAVGSDHGIRYGFAWKDHLGNLERSVDYLASIPGGVVILSASDPAPPDVGRPAFKQDATLERFIPVLDQIVAELRLPPAMRSAPTTDARTPRPSTSPSHSPTLLADCVNPPTVTTLVDLLQSQDLSTDPLGDPLACYGSVPLTFDAAWRGGGEADCPTAPEPAWLACSAYILQPIGDTGKFAPELFVAVDPSVSVSVLLTESFPNIRVTGHFDDPAAQTCRETNQPDAQSLAPVAMMVEGCRRVFVITEVVPLQP